MWWDTIVPGWVVRVPTMEPGATTSGCEFGTGRMGWA